MDRHKRLYKEAMQSPRQHNRINRDRQLANRVQKRKDAYQSSRNFVVSPTPSKGKQPQGENKENAEVPANGEELVGNVSTAAQVNKSRIAMVACGSTNSQKLSRQEAFLLRFIEWKDTQKQQKKQADRKPPFIPCGSAASVPRNKDAVATSSSSFVPKSHSKFIPPSGLKTPALEKEATPAKNCANGVLRKSFYTVVPTPRKNTNKPELPKTASAKSTTSVAKPTANRPITSGSTGKPFVKPRQPNFPRPLPQKPSAAVRKADAPTTKPSIAGAAAKKTVSSSTTGAVGKAHLMQRKRDAQAATAAPPQRNAKLAVSLKAKKPAGTATTTNHSAALAAAIKRTVAPTKLKVKSKLLLRRPACRPSAAASVAIAETPTDPTQVNPFGAFVTSTKVKSLSPRDDRTLNGIGETISPVETIQNEVASKAVDKPLPTAGRTLSHSSSVKRALLQNNECDEHEAENRTKRKFNFVRFSVGQEELELSGVEPQEESLITTNDVKQVRDAPLEPQSSSPQTPPASVQQNGDNAAERGANYLSPYVSVSRGKVSSKKERERRNSVYLQHTPVKANSSPPLDVEARRTLETVRYFRQQLVSETERLLAVCAQWEQYKEQELPHLQQTGGDDMINVAVGQTKLLTSKKFQQFSGLIDRCEAGVRSAAAGVTLVNDGSEKTKPITAVDLEGFWSMLGLQVDNVEKRFENLERWKMNNWCDPAELATEATSVKPKPKTKSTLNKVKKTKPAVGKTAKPSSGLQEMLRRMHAEMRKNKAAAAAADAQITACDTDIQSTPTQRRQRLSQSGTPRSSNAKGRISVVVRDRKLYSPAATLLSLPATSAQQRRLSRASLTRTPTCTLDETTPSLRRSMEELRRSIGKFQKSCDRTELLRTALVGSRPPQQASPPASSVVGQHGRKSILKTPGTAKGKPKIVNFNEKLRIKKFTFTLEDDHSDDGEPETEQQMPMHNSTEHDKSSDTDGERMYSLRTRKVVLRRSSEIQIPK